MTLSAEYKDRLACPHCDAPVRALGSWTVEDGQFFFEAMPIICGERHVLPRWKPDRWSHVTIQRPKIDKRTNEQTGFESVERYHYIAAHECVGDVMLLNGCKAGELLQADECVPYRGEHHPWMEAPEGFIQTGSTRGIVQQPSRDSRVA